MKGRVLARCVSNSSFVLISVLVAAFAISCAGPDHFVGYQGRLTDASGNPINGTKNITFTLWNSPTGTSTTLNRVFTQTRSVPVTNGLLNIDIGATVLDQYRIAGIDPQGFAQPLWLELTIDGQTLSPRQQLLGAPYAMTLVGGAVVASNQEGNGAGGNDDTDIDYGTLSVASTGGGTALVVGVSSAATSSTGDLIRGCKGSTGGRTCTFSGSPVFRVLATGEVQSDVGFNTPAADFAEMLPVEPTHTYVPGEVLAISRTSDGAVALSDQPYSTAVVGVYSTKPGFVGGGGVVEETTAEGSKIPVALVGIVPVKVSAENGAIHRGDLLTTSATPGHAMKASEYRVGTILGKAMGELESGTGVIQAVLTLQ